MHRTCIFFTSDAIWRDERNFNTKHPFFFLGSLRIPTKYFLQPVAAHIWLKSEWFVCMRVHVYAQKCPRAQKLVETMPLQKKINSIIPSGNVTILFWIQITESQTFVAKAERLLTKSILEIKCEITYVDTGSGCRCPALISSLINVNWCC